MTARHKSWLLALVQVVFVLSALELLRRELAAARFSDLLTGLERLSGSQIGIALLLTLASYLVLTGFDLLGLRYVGRPAPLRQTALASLGGHARYDPAH